MPNKSESRKHIGLNFKKAVRCETFFNNISDGEASLNPRSKMRNWLNKADFGNP